MGNTMTARRLYVVLLLGLALTAALLLFTGDAAWAHPCDDNYTEQHEIENCWWRYWNNQSTPEDLTLSAAPDGMLCNSLNALQANREACWWNYQNSLPLITEQPLPPVDMLEPYVMMDDMLKSDSMMDDMAMAEDMMKSDAVMGAMAMADDMMGDMAMADDMMDGSMDGMLCNSLNALQANREKCWWSYHSGLPLITEQPLPPVAAVMPDGMLCDSLNALQPNREACWWNYHNGLPLITEQPIMPADTMESDDMMKAKDM